MYKLFALMVVFCNSLNDLVFHFIGSIEDPKKSRSIFYTIQAAVVVFFCAAYMAVFKEHLEVTATAIFYGVLLGFLSYATYLLLLMCLQSGDVSLNITVYRMNFVIVSILAVIILQEQLTLKKVVGVILLILSILIFSSNSGRRSGFLFNNGLKYSIIGCFVTSMLNMVTKIALNAGISRYTLIFYRFSMVFIIALITMIVSKAPLIPSGRLGAMSGISGVLLFMSISLIYAALGSEEIIVIIPLSQMSFVITAIISFIFYKEPIKRKKIIGICLAIVCVCLII